MSAMDTPVAAHRVPSTPADFPGLIALWDFQDGGPAWRATAGEPYELTAMAGALEPVADAQAPFGPRALRIAEGGWLRLAREHCPRLDIHGPDGHLTLVAWIKRERVAARHCEFIAGQWNETGGHRQYGLFLDIAVWGGNDQVCGHVSNTGGPTPGYRYCMDGAIGATSVAHDEWHCVAMSYDGTHAYAWLDGVLDRRPGVNPYLLPGGLHHGGDAGSDFTVGGVDRGGEMGNWFVGLLGGLAVYDRCLSPAEMWALCRAPDRA